MNQPVLLIAFGALAAALLALLALPLVHRRAERAARQRLEAAMPVSPETIEAARDGLRAEHALAQTRFETETGALREGQAAQAAAAARAETLAATLRAEKDALARMVERLGRELEETTYRASSRQIDLVARESELESRAGELNGARAEIGRLKRALEEAGAAAAHGSLQRSDMQGRAAALTSEVFDAEGRVERKRGEAERLRADLRRSDEEQARLAEELVDARKERMGLEVELDALGRQLSQLFPGLAPGADPAAALQAAAAERDRIEARVAALGRENRALRAALERAPFPAERSLREEMLALAAEVTAMVALLEGPDGAVDRALAASGPAEGGAPPSLAERIRRLRERAAYASPPSSAPDRR